MRLLSLVSLFVAAMPLPAQVTLLFVGRFDSTSLDAPSERSGGSLTALREFDLAYVTPGVAAVARPWQPTTGQAAQLGDAFSDGNYTRFFQLKPSAFERWNYCGPFVKHADRGLANPPVFWTIRDNNVNKRFEVFRAGGSQVVQIRPGDFFRIGHNGETEFFITQTLIAKAKGAPPTGQADSEGASCMVQDAAGNLYWSPEEAGCWVRGNDPTGATAQFVQRAGIIMLRAANITYDAQGNVADVVADSAHQIFGGWNQPGPNLEPSITDMVGNAGAYDVNGNLIDPTASAAVYYNTVGLALDPAGGTLQASFPRDPSGTPIYDTVPNFVFCSDNGTYAGTIFSTRNNTGGFPGSLAVLNGVKCGSDQVGTTPDGAWLGVQLDAANFRPTTMGFALIDVLGYDPFVADAPKDGAIESTDATIWFDFYPGPSAAMAMLLAPGPSGAGTFSFSFDITFLFGPLSYSHFYPLVPPVLTVNRTANPAGYASVSVANPNDPSFVGAVLIVQGATIAGGGRISNPVQLQFK